MKTPGSQTPPKGGCSEWAQPQAQRATSPVAPWVESVPAKQEKETQEMQVRSSGLGRSPGGGHGNPLQYSCLENPVDREAWQATVREVAVSRTRLRTSSAQPVLTQSEWLENSIFRKMKTVIIYRIILCLLFIL